MAIMSMNFKELWAITKETSSEWLNDSCPKLAAALSFYTMIAMAPLLVLLVSMSSLVIGHSEARQHVVQQIAELIGAKGAHTIESMLVSVRSSKAGLGAAIAGIVTFLIGATGVFVELKDSLNLIWKIDLSAKRSVIKSIFKERMISFVMILGVGLLLVTSLVASAFLTAMTRNLGDLLPGIKFFWALVHFVLSLVLTTLLFAMLFKFLPSIKLYWRDVWMGSFLTALLFTIGKSIIGAYLGRGSFGDVYGAAGSFVVILLWVYYSAQIFFWGAEFTQIYTRRLTIQKELRERT